MNNLAIRNSFVVLTLTLLCMLTHTGTGATTLSSGKFADGKFIFIQEEISQPRHLRSLCLLHCGKETKVIYEECIQSCRREYMLDQTHHIRERVIKKTLVRNLRGVNNMNSVINECQIAPQYPKPLEVKGLSVDFTSKKPQVKITWEAIDPLKTDFNWTAYAVIYEHSPTVKKATCRVIPQNQTYYIIPKEHWRYPDSLHVAVVTHPLDEASAVKLKSFDPIVTKTTFTPTAAEKDTTKLAISIVGGLIAGLALLVALYFAIKWRNKRSCPEINIYHQPPPAPQRPENSKEIYYACYYPEGEEFRERIASIVNYFRQNGYNVTMDVMVSGEITSQGPTRWAESQMRKARKVLVFLSPGLINLALDGRAESSQSQDINRVWIELEVLRDIYTRNRSAAKMVCISLPDLPVKSLDLPLWAKVSYKWPMDAQEILKRLNDRPMILPV